MGAYDRNWPRPTVSCLVVFIVACAAGRLTIANPPKFMVEATVKGRYVEGGPLAWSDQRVLLLARDGQIWDFSPDDAQHYRKTASYFAPYSSREMQDRLEAEFGRQMEVTATGHYLVVHSAGQSAVWAGRFEQMYGEFVHNFGVRGISTSQPELPLVAIVFTRHDDFTRYSLGEGFRLSNQALGYYSPKSNRVAMVDIAALPNAAPDWRQNAATVIHETAHQVAYNTGVHNRFAVMPRWLVEGLGTMFEARGVWDSQSYPKQKDRINRGQLVDFKNAAARHKPGTVQELIASDKLFESDVITAYAESWALTFYLAETQPREYSEYLRKTAARPDFTAYTGPQRIGDFTSIFGDDWRMLDVRLARFIGELR